MTTCARCGTVYDDDLPACPRCVATDGDDVTRLAASGRPATPSPATPSPSATTATAGWRSSSADIDHGRFTPGTLLGGRYRIVGRLGRGGMGEVFRADDLKVGQIVALKFLPADVDRDPARLTQLHSEVRMARQVSHPNVCRVYDIDEVDGHTFLSMEYVDGEDLSLLLRRIGRYPEDRALDVARQLCAGLAAAHARGVLHRDFKPANVMIDGAGNVRIMDFGLAGVTGESLRAGTPAYMAPEQLAGGEVTARSDIYALGLVLYELFTGRRAVDAANLAELIRKREQSGILPPSEIVRDLSPEIDRAIMLCLRPDPAARPASTLAVAAALPGGDPLAAALAAGELPSPEMIAAAGQKSAVHARPLWLSASWIACGLVLLALAYQHILLVNLAPLPKPPAALIDRAQDAVAALGYAPVPRSTAAGFTVSTDYLRFLETLPVGNRWAKLETVRPETFVFWYRTSPRRLVPLNDGIRVTGLDPPLNVSGMTLAVVDATGRLSEFHAVPEAADTATSARPVDWSPLFVLSGFDRATLHDVPPKWLPLVYADERAAWEGALPDRPDLTVRLDAAAYHGRVVFFGLTGPWTHSARDLPNEDSLFTRVVAALASLVQPGLILAGAVLARRNLRQRRGDRAGALRAAAFVFVVTLLGWLLAATHVAGLDLEVNRVFRGISTGLFDSAVVWVAYLGLEPYVRRASPDSLIGWTRLLAGRWRDPHVGMDILAGVSTGVLAVLLFSLYYVLPRVFGWHEPMPVLSETSAFMGVRFILADVMQRIGNGFNGGMLATVGVVGLLILLRRRSLALAAGIVIFTPVVINPVFNPGQPLLALILGAAMSAVIIDVALRFGLLATVISVVTQGILLEAPVTTDLSAWRSPTGLLYFGVVAALTAWGIAAARSGVGVTAPAVQRDASALA